MNILLVGGSCSLMNQMIIKLNKEGHRIYLLTGDRYKNQWYGKVFERYDFPYDSDCLSDVFDSVNPDMTIFLGIHDPIFQWQDERRESVRFSSSLMNLLMAHSVTSEGRFLFLSSQEVFSNNHPNNITEEEETSAVGFRAMALAQAEEMCDIYRRTRNLDIVVLRLDHYYSIPMERKNINNICASMCMEALESDTISIHANNRFSLLYEADAIEFIYRVLVCEKHNQFLYHLSSSEEINELELAQLVRKYITAAEERMDKDKKKAARKAKAENGEEGQPESENGELATADAQPGEEENINAEQEKNGGIRIVRLQESGNSRCILSNQLYDSEFGVKIFNQIEPTVEKMANHMVKNKEVFLTGEKSLIPWWKRFLEKSGWLLRALVPFIENLICFIPFFMLNNRAVGSEYFSNLDFYLLYVLLFAIVYGQQQATFSAVLAVAGYCFRQMYTRSGFEVFLDYNTYVWIAQLFILGLVVGYMRDQLREMRSESQESTEYLNAQLDDIRDINKSNVRVKDALEVQIVNQNDSVGKIYNITSTLDQYTPEEVLFYAAEILSKLLGSEDVAIYQVSNADYARLFSSTSARARELGNSIKYTEMGEVYETLMSQKVYINRTMDKRYPLMANAIFENGGMQMIVMAWGIPWESMTLGQANLFVVVSYLIQNAVLRANRYLEALEDKRYRGGTRIMETDAFTSLVHAYMSAKRKDLVECTLLQLFVQPEQYSDAAALLTAKLRQTDYLGTLEDGGLYVLLANTKPADAEIVINRFAQLGYTSKMTEEIML